MTAAIEMGHTTAGASATLDLEELLATRLLVQGNSGSGKSHLLRRLLEQSAPWVQQTVIDPEGDFVTLAERFGHLLIDAEDHTERGLQVAGERARIHRVSTVLNLEGLDAENQMRRAAAFLGGLFDAERDHWYPMLVVVDEAQLFAPAAAGEVSDEARRASLGAMTNLMCRGRKRGLAGVIATQRLAKLAKNVAAEASNFLMGRTFLDIDMVRAADLLGMERRQAEAIRDLARGEFLALGPAITRRPTSIRIGDVRTAAKSASPKLVPLPGGAPQDMQDLLFAPFEERAPAPPPPPVRTDDLLRAISSPPTPQAPVPDAPLLEPEEQAAVMASVLGEIISEGVSQPQPTLFQDFSLRCRMLGVTPDWTLAEFGRRLALALAGIDQEEGWEEAFALAAALPEEMLAPFLLLARAARDGSPCLASVYRTASAGRARRMLEFIEQKGL